MRARTTVSQKLPNQLDSIPSKFYEDAARFVRIGKYPLSFVGNTNETPAFFDIILSKCITKTGVTVCVVRSSESEKKHLTAVLSLNSFPNQNIRRSITNISEFVNLCFNDI